MLIIFALLYSDDILSNNAKIIILIKLLLPIALFPNIPITPSFERKSILFSEQMIAEKLRKENKVTDTTLEKLFGSAKDVTDAGYITAYYYQNLQAQKADGKLDSFTVFQTAQKNKEAEIENIKKKYKKTDN